MPNFVCDVGDVAYIQNVFTNSGGTAVDPTSITLYLEPPVGGVGTYTYAAAQVQRLAEGTYYYNGTATMGGYWQVRWTGDGAVIAASQSRYFVRETNT